MAWSNFKIVPLLLFPLMLFSCGNEIKYEERILLQSQYNIDKPILIDDLNTLNNMIVNDETFLIYIYSHSCSACEIYTPLVENYVKLNQVVMYSVDVASENTLLRPENGLMNYMETPTLILYSEGNVIFRASPTYVPDPFISSNNMKTYIEQYAYISQFVSINSENDLSNLIAKNEEVLIYYYYEKCGDCTFFESNYLDKYFTRVNARRVYRYEMSYNFDNREDSSSPIYKNFTDKYGLSKDGNNKFGYNNGVVPTLQKYKKGVLVDARVIFNDEFELIYDTNNELDSLKIKSSYYLNNPNIGKIYKKTSDNTALNVYHEQTLNYFIEKFNELL